MRTMPPPSVPSIPSLDGLSRGGALRDRLGEAGLKRLLRLAVLARTERDGPPPMHGLYMP